MISLFKVHMPQAVDGPLLETLHSGYIGQGKKVDEFEQVLGEYFGNPNVLTVNSATSALTIALRLAGVDVGSDVLTTPMTCTATNLPILSLSANPIFIDIDPRTGLADPNNFVHSITKNTKALMLVDWGGAVVDVREFYDNPDFIEIQKRWNLDIKIIVDAAHAMGGQYSDGAMEGSRADYTCFSLQAIKHITTGDGGILTCQSKVDYERAKLMRWYGIKRESVFKDSRIDQDIDEWGYKFHMNDLNATIGIVQMDYIDQIIRKQRANALYYNEHLNDDFYTKPLHIETGANWLYTLLLPDRSTRDNFQKFMTEKGIMASQVHKRNDDYAVFRPYTPHPPHVLVKNHFPGVDAFTERMICIPVHWDLTDDDISYIVSSCNEFAQL